MRHRLGGWGRKVAALVIALAAVLLVAALAGATDGFVDPSTSSTVVAAGGTKTVPETLHLDGAAAPQVDVVIAMDSTNSMDTPMSGGANAPARLDAKALIDQFAGVDARFAVRRLLDDPQFDGTPAGTQPYQEVLPFSSDPAAVKNAIDTQTPFGPGALPGQPEEHEAHFGLFTSVASQVDWRPNAQKWLVVFSDQIGHDTNANYFTATDNEFCTSGSDTQIDSGGVAGSTNALQAAGVKADFVNYVTLYGALMRSCQASISRLTGGHGAYSQGEGANAGKGIAGGLSPNRVLSDFYVNVNSVSWPGGPTDSANDPVANEWIDVQNAPANPVSVPPSGMDIPLNVSINPPEDASPGTYVVDVIASWADGTQKVTKQLTFTVAPPLTSIALTVDQTTVPAGVKRAPLGSIPPDRLALASGSGDPDAAPIGSTPIASTPIASTPIASTPIASTPIASTPIASTGLLSSPIASTPIASTPIASTALQHVLLSQITLKGTTWDNVLCDPLNTKPLNALTLADVAGNACSKTKFEALTLGQVDLSTTLLRGVHWSSLLWGNVTFAQLPGGLAAYQAKITEAGGGNPSALSANDTPLGADIAGALGQTSSIGSTPIASTPIASTPIASTPIASTHVTSSRLASVRVAAMTPASVIVDCTRVDCASTSTATLGSAAALNAILPTATFGNPALIPAFAAAGITMNDIVTALLAASDFPWEKLPVQGLQSVAGTGQNATYHLTVGLDCSVIGEDGFDATVVLPDGFYPVPGTSTVTFGGPNAANPIADPRRVKPFVIEGPPLLDEYVWNITCPGAAGGAATAVLSFQSFAGLTLGKQTSSAHADLDGFTISTGPGKAPITVTENWETNDDATTAPQIAPDELAVGHIGATGDQDFFRLPLSGLPRGTRVSVYLSHISNGADFDLTVGKPSAQGFFSTPIASTPIASTPIEDFGVTVDNTGVALPSEALQDIAVGSTPIASTPIASTSTTRGSSDEQAQFITQGESGFATIGVTGYNGSSSNSPYVLRVKETAPPPLPTNCPAPTFMGGNPSSIPAGSLVSSVPTTTKTLFIVNKQRLTALYGATPVNSMLTSLNTLAARTEVAGTVLNVDGNKAVRDAYTAWDGARCSVDAANNVVRSINDVIAGFRAINGIPAVKFVVLVGGDDAVPMFRTPDPVLLSPELNEANDLAFTTAGLTQGNPLYASAATNNILGDGAYGTTTAIPWLGHDLMLPQLSVARLVEQPTDIKGQLDQYITQNGVVSTTGGGVVTGYDFLADGAAAVKANLNSTYPASTQIGGHDAIQPIVVPPATTPIPGWTSTDAKTGFLTATAPAALAALNGHYNHYELEAADGSLAAAGDASAATPGRLIFTMGCHGGLNVPGSAGQAKDWAEVWGSKKVAMYLANTGYGYGDSASVALSERLMALFAKNLHSDSGTVGEQWVNALHQYFATAGAYDVYDEKVMAETTFYGLPFWKFATNGPSSPPAPLPTSPDPITGTQAATINFTDSGPNVDLHTQFGLYRPNLQIRSQEVTSATPARGLWINALSTTDLATGPTIGYPTVDVSTYEPTPNIKPIFFPASPFTLERSTAFGKSRDFVNVSDQFRPGSTSPTRHVTSAAFKVLYSYSSDTSPPLISQVDVTRTGGGATVVQARINDDQEIDDAAALVYTAVSAWMYVPLHVSPDDPSLYVSNSFNTSVEPEVFVESTDGTNVSYSANKGRNFTTNTSGQVPGPRIVIKAPFGPYTQGQAVNASYQCLPNIDPVTSCTGTVPTGSPIDTSTPGVHTFVVRAEDQSGDNTALVRTYTVQFPFRGFFQPVDNEPIVNTVNSGRAIPVKFSLGGNFGLDIFAPGYPKSQAVGCDSEDPASPIESTVTAGQSSLSYDAGNDQYNYVWKTDDGWANQCRILVIKLKDGSSHEAKFRFKK